MSRDEMAFKILLTILETTPLRTIPLEEYAKTAFRLADAFIEAGITDEMRQRAGEYNVKLSPGPSPDWRV